MNLTVQFEPILNMKDRDYSAAITDFTEKTANGERVFGLLNPPDTDHGYGVDVEKIAFIVKDVYKSEDKILLDIEIIKTPDGKIFLDLVNTIGVDNFRFTAACIAVYNINQSEIKSFSYFYIDPRKAEDQDLEIAF